jgi:hypothetical protein
MCLPQLVNDLTGFVSYVNSCVHIFAQKNPIAFLS